MKRGVVTNIDPRASEAYGALLESVHIAGYTFERACSKLEWLLAEPDRWQLGGRFTDINVFMDSIKLDNLKSTAEQRKRIALKIKQYQPKVSNRRIAKALGVDEGTVRRDTAENSARAGNKLSNNKGTKLSTAENSAPALMSGVEVARLVARRDNAVDRRDERLARIEEIARGNSELPTGIRYPIILADPPWRYENPPMGDSNRSIENQYPTMTLAEICALPVADLAADDAQLYLWATAPKLYECMKVLDAWGFEYRTNGCWDKEIIGTGYHFRNQHEQLLVAKRGEIPPPLAGEQPSSIYRERRSPEHSRKPEFYYEMIERAYPTLPKIELFARGPARPGWIAWGNQALPEAAE